MVLLLIDTSSTLHISHTHTLNANAPFALSAVAQVITIPKESKAKKIQHSYAWCEKPINHLNHIKVSMNVQ